MKELVRPMNPFAWNNTRSSVLTVHDCIELSAREVEMKFRLLGTFIKESNYFCDICHYVHCKTLRLPFAYCSLSQSIRCWTQYLTERHQLLLLPCPTSIKRVSHDQWHMTRKCRNPFAQIMWRYSKRLARRHNRCVEMPAWWWTEDIAPRKIATTVKPNSEITSTSAKLEPDIWRHGCWHLSLERRWKKPSVFEELKDASHRWPNSWNERGHKNAC